jgi:uncharacterized membrane protein YsdA (DUF1294 family)/cold shock CspA family protein
MRKQGSVIRWDDARGFGFIRSPSSNADVYFHARDFRGAAAERPRQGQSVTFEEIHVGGKGPRAMAVQLAGSASTMQPSSELNFAARQRAVRRREEHKPSSGASIALPLMLAYVAVVAWGGWTKRLPWWVLVASPVLNALTFYAYWQDKYAATQKKWRTREDTLHLFSLAGGWWGAWLAHQVLRHKSAKLSFRSTYWATVVLHCAALAGWLWWLGPLWRSA